MKKKTTQKTETNASHLLIRLLGPCQPMSHVERISFSRWKESVSEWCSAGAEGFVGRDDVVFNEVKDAEPGCASLLSVFHPLFAACAFIVCHQKERKRFWWASIFVLTPERGSGLAVSSLTWNPFSVKVICEGRLCVGMKKLSWPLHRLWAGAEHHLVFVLFTCTS